MVWCMASLGDVGDALRRVLDKIDQAIAARHQAADLAEHARELLAIAGFGTLQADVEQTRALFTRVIEGISSRKVRCPRSRSRPT